MTYIISDIHGHYEELMQLLKMINFSDSDTLIIDGDLSDKGPKPVETIKFAMNTPNVITLLGNHDLMAYNMLSSIPESCRNKYLNMLRERKNTIYYDYSLTATISAFGLVDDAALWFGNSGKYTLKCFLKAEDSFIDKYLLWISKRPLFQEVTVGSRAFLISHAGVDMTGYESCKSIDPSEIIKLMDTEEVVWNRYIETLLKQPDMQKKLTKTLVLGHTPTYCFDKEYAGKIVNAENVVCIDCGAAYRKWWSRLGCIRLEDMHEFYMPCMDVILTRRENI